MAAELMITFIGVVFLFAVIIICVSIYRALGGFDQDG